MDYYVPQMAHAFVMIYKSRPEEVGEEVRRLMLEIAKTEFARTDEWQNLSQASFAGEWDNPENDFWNSYLRNSNPTGENV